MITTDSLVLKEQALTIKKAFDYNKECFFIFIIIQKECLRMI
jgi:hypothetical protein